MFDLDTSIPLTLKAAAYNGILSPNVQPLPASCPTGNCTWPITPTLAICGGCSQSTYQKSSSCFTAASYTEWRQHPTQSCTYTMPSGGIATLSLDSSAFQVMPSKGAFYNTSDSSMLYIANFDLIGHATSWSSNIVAAECAMWFCVQAYDIKVTTTQQTQLSQNFSKVVGPSPETDYGVFSNYTFLNLPAGMNQRYHSQFIVTSISASSYENFLKPLFNGTVHLESNNSDGTALTEVEPFPSSDIIEAIWNAKPNLDVWIKNVALSLTNALRVFDPALDDLYNGTGHQLGFQVRWEWIILPAVLVLSSLLILIVTIAKTARSPVQAWKGSPLALLFTDVDQDIRKRAEGRMDVYQGLEDSVGKIEVMMKNDEHGNWAFKAA